MTAIDVVLPILTVVCSGVVAALVAHRLSKRREAVALRRQKLEQLYMAYTGFCRLLISHHMPYAEVMRGKITFNQALDITIGTRRDTDEHHYEAAQMLMERIRRPEQDVPSRSLKLEMMMGESTGACRET